MKVAVVLGAFSIGSRPLDFNQIWTNPRGLTGTDLCFVQLCQELKELGNEVHMFTVHVDIDRTEWQGMALHNFDDRMTVVDDTFDAIISINEPNILFNMAKKPIRIVWQMLNDFSFIQPGFDDEVDLYLAVCKEHEEHMKKQTPKPEKWKTVELGCNPDWYQDKRVSGRVVWCSSADRGLHWLLQQWPEIKEAVPEATLKIFYHFNYGEIAKVEKESISPQGGPYHHHIQEMAQRIRYMKDALERLKPLGVEHVGAISREQIKEEWNQASVFGFSCDTVAFSEGFSVSTLEAHASFTVPVITSQDCLGGIYQDSGAIIIDTPVKNHLPEFTQAVIRGLTDKKFADATIDKCRQFAAKYTWKTAATKINDLLVEKTTTKKL